MEEKTFASLGRVEAIRQLYEGTSFKPFQEPLRIETQGRDNCVTATSLLLEGVDFDLVYFPLQHLGAKAVLSVTGELYASLAHPRTLSVTLGVSAKLDFKHIKELWSGVCHAAREHGYLDVSLELQPSRNGLAISLSGSGLVRQLTAARRLKPQSKELLCVSGSLGAAYLGMQVLEREKLKFENGGQARIDNYKMLVAAYLRPELPSGVVAQMEDSDIYPSCGMFVRHGLADAALRIARETGLGVKIYADKIPFEGGSFDFGREADIDTVSAAMNGGDDYKLLFTIPIRQYEYVRKDFQTFDIIGHLCHPEVGTVVVTPDGIELPLTAQGW